MLQNKIYQNYLIEISKSFLMILFALSLIALTVRAVSFLDLIVENGYQLTVYLQYSLLNLFGIIPKFIPLSFLVALTIFILKHLDDSEFVILWTSGEKKIYVVNLFIIFSMFVVIFYFILSTFFTPLALNKSRQILGNDQLSSLLPTVKTQQFSDSFKGFTFFVEKKINNEIEKKFIHDTGNNLKKLSSNISENNSTSVLAKSGIVKSKNLILYDGQIISSKNDAPNELIKFEKLNIDLSNLSTTTIKKPKIQETSTFKLISCLILDSNNSNFCNEGFKKEILPNLNRRIIIPFYIPALTLICSMLLFKSRKIYYNKFLIFTYSFMLLLFTELAVRYTGINNIILFLYLIIPFVLIISLYIFLNYKFSKEIKTS